MKLYTTTKTTYVTNGFYYGVGSFKILERIGRGDVFFLVEESPYWNGYCVVLTRHGLREINEINMKEYP